MSWLRTLIATGVRNPVYANMLMVVLAAGGLVAARTLVRETYPEFSLDRISISVLYPGASPIEVEQGVCTKIEEALRGLANIKLVWSQAEENTALVVVELHDRVDARLMMLDIKDRIDRIDTFPPEVERPLVSEMLAREQVINVAVHGEVSERTIKEYANEIKNELLSGGKVSQVRVRGVRDDEISIQVSREALLQYGLTLDAVATVVARNCVDIPAGTLRTDREELALRTTGQRYSAREFEDLVIIARPDGTLVRLGHLAKVTDGFADDFRLGRFQGQPAAVLDIFKTPDQDTSSIARTVRDYVTWKRGQLPERLHLDTWADTSREVDARIDMLVSNALQGMALVVLLLTVFMDLRISFYVAIGVPLSVAGAFIVMHFTGQTLNMISLFGLIMVTGIIVDDAIVVADSYRLHVSAGESPRLAALNGPAHVALPVLLSSGTTIVAFLPLLFVVGILGKFISVLPVVVISAVFFSGIEAFCVLPSHLQHCLHPGQATGRLAAWRRRYRSAVEGWIDCMLTRGYRPVAMAAVRARWLTLAGALACLLVAIGLVAGWRIPFMLLPEIDSDTLRARVEFPPGIPPSQTERAAQRLEAAANQLNNRDFLPNPGKEDLVIRTFTTVGEWSGWVTQHGGHLCEVVIELTPGEHRRVDNATLLAKWAQATGPVSDALSVTFDRVQRGPTEKPLEIRLLGDDLEQLEAAAIEVSEGLLAFAGVSGVERDLQPGKREMRITLKPLARTLGVTVEDLARQIRSSFHGGEAVRIQRGREDVRVQVRLPDHERGSIADIENLLIAGPGGNEIPFRELAEYHIERGHAVIRHQDGQRRVRIVADVDKRVTNAERILATFEKDFLRKLPARYPGTRYRIEGQHAQIVESLRSLLWAFALALVAMYGILASSLGSYVQPMVIMAAIPLGFVGAAAGHLLMGYELTMMSIFGMVALSGVVVNDALVLLSQINDAIREGKPVFQAVVGTGETRFRAVFLTTATTVAGLTPLLLERNTQAESLVPMAIALTFGLAWATVLTLVVIPAMSLALNDVQRFVHWLRRGGPYPSAETVAAGAATVTYE